MYEPNDEGQMTTHDNIVNLHNVNDIQACLSDVNNVYVGRFVEGFNTEFKWGNPYRLKKYKSRKKVLALYEKHIGKNDLLLKSIAELKGKRLGCWCAPHLCHAEILHRLAGNPSPRSKMTETSPAMDASAETCPLLTMKDPQLADELVTKTLKAMNDVLERVSEDVNNTPLIDINTLMPRVPCDVAIPTVDVATPPISPPLEPIPSAHGATTALLTMSVAETNDIYETLLESNSSDDLSHGEISTKSRSPLTDQCLSTKQRLDINWKLNSWRLKHSKSLPSSFLCSPSRETVPGRKFHSAPSSPTRRPRKRISSHPGEFSTLLNTPTPFSYYTQMIGDSSFNEFDEQPYTDATREILEFLAHKVDLLSVSINTIQYNLTKISENFHATLGEKIQGTDTKLEKTISDKFTYLETKFDNYKSSLHQEFEAVKAENLQLKINLENYICEESEREDQIKECLNNLHCPDYIPFKEDLKAKLSEFETRLSECERSRDSHEPETRLRSFSDECRNDPSTHNSTHEDVGVLGDRNYSENASADLPPDDLNDKVHQLEKSLDERFMELSCRVLECEQYSRRECLVISGIPAYIKEDKLDSTVIDILKKLEIYIAPTDISAIHRLGQTRDPRYPARVIVKFVNRKIIDLCHQKKDRLPDLYHELKMNIRFYESLAQLNQESLKLCAWLFSVGKIHDYFLRNGFSKIVIAENDKPVKVPHPQFLRDKFNIPEDIPLRS